MADGMTGGHNLSDSLLLIPSLTSSFLSLHNKPHLFFFSLPWLDRQIFRVKPIPECIAIRSVKNKSKMVNETRKIIIINKFIISFITEKYKLNQFSVFYMDFVTPYFTC